MKQHMGKVVVTAMAVTMLALYVFIDKKVVPTEWVRAFAEDVAYRAIWAGEFEARETYWGANGLEEPDNKHVCLGAHTKVEWSQAHVFAGDRGLEGDAAAKDWQWGAISPTSLANRMKAEDTVQFIVLVRDGEVVDAPAYYTFWGDLSGLAVAQGFTPTTAVFTAHSVDGGYRVVPAYDVESGQAPFRDCPHLMAAE